MESEAGRLLQECIDAFRSGTLTEGRLQDLKTALRGSRRVQDLLYMQTATTSVESKVIGITMVRGGEVDDGPADYDDWPYKTVAEAIRDGWRVIRLPAQVPAAHSQDRHVICEFVLERFPE